MWTSPTPDEMHKLSMRVFKPLELLVNYTLLQYLMAFYWSRKLERRVQLLFVIGSVGIICLVPFANQDQYMSAQLNDVSEACCTVTFLLQITIVGYDLNRKIKFKSILRLTYIAELLIAINIILAVVSGVATIKEGLIGPVLADHIPNVVEIITLAFVFGFRVYCIAAASSWSELWTARRGELLCYFLFATHEFPFSVLEEASGLSWETVQSLWNRVTIAMCLFMTVRTKLHSSRSSVSRTTSEPMVRTTKSRLASLAGLPKQRESASAAMYKTVDVQSQQSGKHQDAES